MSKPMNGDLKAGIQQAMDSFPVDPFARVVPAGITTRDGRRFARFTLVVTPSPVTQSSAGLDLRSWPAGMIGLLRGKDGGHPWQVKLTIRDKGGKNPAGLTAKVLRWPENFDEANADVDPGDLTRLWQETIEFAYLAGRARDRQDEPCKSSWQSLAKSLMESMTNKAIGVELKSPTDKIDPPEGEKGQRTSRVAEAGTRYVEAISHHPQTDLALALEYERAEDLILALPQAIARTETGKDEAGRGKSECKAKSAIDCEVDRAKAIAREAEKMFASFLKDNDIADFQKHLEHLRSQLKSETDRDKRAALQKQLRELENAPLKYYRQAEHQHLHDALQGNRMRGQDAYVNAGGGSSSAGQAGGSASGSQGRNGAGDLEKPTAAHCLALATRSEERHTKITAATQAHRFAHWETHRNQDETERGKPRAEVKRNDDEAASQAFFTIQSTPALARLYCFAFDLEAELDGPGNEEATEIYFNSRENTFVSVTAQSVETAACLGHDVKCATPWTIAVIGPNAGETRTFLPATFEQASFDKKGETGRKSQPLTLISGFKALWSEKSCETGPGVRFDLTSLDVRAAAQLYSNHLQSLAARRLQNPGEEQDNGAGPADSDLVEALAVAYQTAGLAFLNGRAVHEKAAALVRKTSSEANFAESNGCCLIDANDLNVGLRIDVAIPIFDPIEKKMTVRWRPLCHRHSDYGHTGEEWAEGFADRAIRVIAGEMREHERMAFDAATISLPDQLIPRTDAGQKDGELTTATQVELFIPEDIGVWTGAPLALDIVRAARRAGPLEGDSKSHTGYFGTDSCRPASADILPFGRILSLPTKDDPTRYMLPPRLRFGWPYRISMRAAFSGGVSAPVGPPATAQDEPDLAYPPSIGGKDHFFRFLRQQPIADPVLLLPAAKVPKPNGIMGHEAAKALIVRRLDVKGEKPAREASGRAKKAYKAASEDVKARAKPTLAQRIILPPSMHMEEAVRHGVLDHLPVHAPPGAYRDYRWDADAENGGFPVVCTVSGRGFNGVPYPLADRTIDVYANKQEKLEQNRRNPKFNDISYGDAVLTASKQRPLSATQYFPDPCADTLVIALRLPGTGEYLPGPPIQVKLSKHFKVSAYPDIPPLILSVEAIDGPARQVQPRHENIAHRIKAVRLDPENNTDIAQSGGPMDAIDIRLSLCPGEAFEADIWFAPSMEHLRDWFSLPQSVAILWQLSRNETESAFGKALRERISNYAGGSSKPPFGGLCLMGPGGFAIEDPTRIEAVADLIHETLMQRPLRQIAGLTTVTLAHASNKLNEPVHMSVAEQALYHRTANATHSISGKAVSGKGGIRFHRVSEKAFLAHLNGTADPHDEENQSAAYLSGEIEIDLARCSGFDIVLEGASLGGPDMDDPKRTRAVIEKRSGTWPILVDTLGRAHYKNVRQIYGFDVGRDGRVKLPRQQVVLYEVRGLPARIKGYPVNPETGRTTLPLADLLYSRLLSVDQKRKSPFSEVVVTPKHQFGDPKSRELDIFIRALPRTAEMLRTAPRQYTPAQQQNTATRKDAEIEEAGDFIPATALPSEQLVTASPPLRIILPGTRRPATPATLAPVHRFRWEADEKIEDDGTRVVSMTRHTSVRIPLERGWYSSGDSEKLGLVVWPPDLLPVAQSGDQPLNNNSNKLTYKSGKSHQRPRKIVLDDFRDEDLGPGGAFTSRWGADPLRSGQSSTSHFIQAHDFLDVNEGQTEEFVGFATMPLFEAVEGAAKKSDKNEDSVAAKVESTRSMSVGVLPYTPRFDPATDRWYVDVQLEHPSFDQPFLRLGLVRYDRHVREDLQVSTPAVQWTQLLPKREVVARWNAAERRLQITIEGTASLRAIRGSINEYDPGTDATEHMRSNRAPAIYAILFLERTFPSGAKERRPVEMPVGLDDTDDGASIDIPAPVPRTRPWFSVPLQDGSGERFKWDGTFAGVDVKPGDNERLVLFLEEIEHRRPATYPQEPVTLEELETPEGDIFAESGPRFSARLVLEEAAGEASDEEESK